MPRKSYESKDAKAVGPYSHAVDAGELVYLSGQTPIDPSTGELTKGGIGEQTRQCFANLFAVLEAAGLTSDDVVKVNVYLTDMNNFADMNEVYQTQFSEPFPARTTVAVLALPLGAEVEIEMIAKRG
ncbi:RidA family protein [Bacillus sp. B-jedd]|uniref:RidA family protein n=1 Tax=Bacillus sp. B-jedd TaxID=1476857 RepID=UPI0005157017|nr:RidA family protein [Bacillus sp. B-jedd]CEG25764.1 endoribonuclease L-PSP [Bacillus sp. B-jedd]